jgi:hypothetical protein
MARNRLVSKVHGSIAGMAAALAFGAGLAAVAALPSHAETSQMSPAEAALYQKAKAEGAVSVWGPVIREVNWIPAEFAKRYPGI